MPKSVAVDTSGLDLSDPSDVSTLYRRIQHAARQVCDPEDLDLYRRLVRGYGECYRQTVADAVARVKDRHLRGGGRPRSAAADEPAGS
ncbi:MAG: UrcA family protein [Steroidobacter sp.]